MTGGERDCFTQPERGSSIIKYSFCMAHADMNLTLYDAEELSALS